MKTLTLFLFCVLALSISAQSPTPFEPVIVIREYMKVMPGKGEDYLKIEALWKKVHQRRVTEGKIVAWQLLRKVAPHGADSPYDYMTITVFKNGKAIDDMNTMNWDYITKGMSVAEITLINDTELTRKLINSEWTRLLERVQPSGKYIQYTDLTAAVGKGDELEAMEKMMNPVFVELSTSGKIAGWRFGEKLYSDHGVGGYYRVITTNSINDMLTWAENKSLENGFKKVYPNKDFDATMKSFRDIITLTKTELWEVVDTTTN